MKYKMKTEVYSWRVSAGTKAALETEARQQGVSLAALLDRISGEWLESRRGQADDEEQQARLHEAAAKCFGTISGDDPGRSERVREIVRERLRKRDDARRAD